MAISHKAAAFTITVAVAIMPFTAAAFAGEAGPTSGTSVGCDEETWPNISPDCAFGAKAKTVRNVRVISLDAGGPTSVPLPEGAKAAYASRTIASNTPVVTPDTVPDAARPTITPLDDERAIATADRKRIDRRADKDARLVTKKRMARRQDETGLAAHDAYASGEQTVYQDAYGRRFVMRPTADRSRAGARYGEMPEQRFNPFGGF